MARADVISHDERLTGSRVLLRLLMPSDCNSRYLGWLHDPDVNRYLETRWREQTMDTIRTFVAGMAASPDDYLFAIVARSTAEHVGNLKIGPVNRNHAHADVSYFIGEKAQWGRGYATEAISLAVRFAFARLRLHRVQAGVYERNAASARALQKVGFVLEGNFRRQLREAEGDSWQDHLWYGLLAEEWSVRNDA